MAKHEKLKFPDDFEANMRALLATPPAPHGTTGSRKAAPKPPAKPKKKWRRKLTSTPEHSPAALAAQAKHHRDKLAETIKKAAQPKRKKR